MRQAQACMLAGACFAVGLRFAGSGNQQAHDLLRSRLLYFLTRLKSLVGPVPTPVTFYGSCKIMELIQPTTHRTSKIDS